MSYLTEEEVQRIRDSMERFRPRTVVAGLETSYPPEIADAVQCIEDMLNDEDGAYDKAMDWLKLVRTKYPPRRLIDKMKIIR